MGDSHPIMPSAGHPGMPDEMVRAISASTVTPLTKKGRTKEGLSLLLTGSFGAIILFTFGFWIHGFGGLSPEEWRESISTSGWIFGWLSAILLPLAPIAPYFHYILFVMGILGILSAINGGYQLATASASSTLDIRCPRCGETFQFSQTVRRSFSFVCTRCHALVQGGKLGYNALYHCTYCDFEYYGAPNKEVACPGCGFMKGAKDQKCPQCHATVPKGVRFCQSCSKWLVSGETHEVSITSQPVVYNVTTFSPKACRPFILDMLPRIGKYAETIDGTLGPIKNLRKDFQLYGNGGFIWTLEPALDLINSCTRAVQWLYCAGGTLEAVHRSDFHDNLRKIKPQIDRILETDLLLKSHRNKFREIVSSADRTISAAMRLPASSPVQTDPA